MANNTVTGVIALIKVDGLTIGRCRDVRASETYGRADVRGIGNLQVVEKPIISHKGTFSVDVFLVDMESDGVKGLINRKVASPQEFVNTVLFGNDKGVDLYLYKKIPKTINPTSGVVTEIEEVPIAILRRCFLDSVSLNISEGQISTHSQSGTFLDPIIFTP